MSIYMTLSHFVKSMHVNTKKILKWFVGYAELKLISYNFMSCYVKQNHHEHNKMASYKHENITI